MALVNRVDLAGVLGCSLPTVDAHVRRGCPYVERGGRGKEWRFDSAEVIAWLRQTDVEDAIGGMENVSLDEARRRDVVAAAQIKEYELARLRRTMISVDEIGDVVSEEYAIVRSRLKAIPGRTAQALAAEGDPATVEAMLTGEIDDALSELSADDDHSG